MMLLYYVWTYEINHDIMCTFLSGVVIIVLAFVLQFPLSCFFFLYGMKFLTFYDEILWRF
ncbi:hypothetical protein RchiOBHm_Chr6g0300841 [Rosa chinensis]|uniref:Uncharacterized protein n=1 Tax=Rosa chinensis TaxID=74649 RepID=A0A2P6PYJ8_ROSCH|nr:hypothetical protein RchiOBHm_Chr6g0300841 [Rosa chinensis]